MNPIAELDSIVIDLRCLIQQGTVLLSQIEDRPDVAGVTKDYARQFERIIQCVCLEFGVKREEIFSRLRTDEVSAARHVAMFIAREKLDLSSTAIGKLFKRDHGSILHGCKEVIARCDTNAEFKKRFSAAMKRFNDSNPDNSATVH